MRYVAGTLNHHINKKNLSMTIWTFLVLNNGVYDCYL